MILAHFIAHTHIKLTAHIPHCRYAVLPCRIPSPYVTSRHVRNTYEYSLHVYTSLPNSKAADILYITSTYQTYTMSCQSVIIPDTDTDTDSDTQTYREQTWMPHSWSSLRWVQWSQAFGVTHNVQQETRLRLALCVCYKWRSIVSKV